MKFPIKVNSCWAAFSVSVPCPVTSVCHRSFGIVTGTRLAILITLLHNFFYVFLSFQNLNSNPTERNMEMYEPIHYISPHPKCEMKSTHVPWYSYVCVLSFIWFSQHDRSKNKPKNKPQASWNPIRIGPPREEMFYLVWAENCGESVTYRLSVGID